MMPSISSFVQRVYRTFERTKSPQFSESRPKNLVRLCRNRNDFISVINQAVNSPDKIWDQELISRVVQCILEDENSGISVYSSDTLDALDRGHALAVIYPWTGQAASGKPRRRCLGARRIPHHQQRGANVSGAC